MSPRLVGLLVVTVGLMLIAGGHLWLGGARIEAELDRLTSEADAEFKLHRTRLEEERAQQKALLDDLRQQRAQALALRQESDGLVERVRQRRQAVLASRATIGRLEQAAPTGSFDATIDRLERISGEGFSVRPAKPGAPRLVGDLEGLDYQAHGAARFASLLAYLGRVRTAAGVIGEQHLICTLDWEQFPRMQLDYRFAVFRRGAKAAGGRDR